MQNPPSPTPSFASISSFNLINFFVPGVLFIFILNKTTNLLNLPQDTTTLIILYYIAGIAVNRFGSLYIRKMLKFFSLIKETEDAHRGQRYENYIDAKRYDHELKEITQMSDLYKTFIAVIFLSVAFNIYEEIRSCCAILVQYEYLIFTLLILLLALKSYIVQDDYIQKRVARFVKANTTTKEK
jgi:hypothetical protein